jgi:hypothetical protein
MNRQQNALDELRRLQTCLSTLGELMIPDQDLNCINRDGLATLLGYLDEQLQQALAQLEQDYFRLKRA